jgi:hypothetical protein
MLPKRRLGARRPGVVHGRDTRNVTVTTEEMGGERLELPTPCV